MIIIQHFYYYFLSYLLHERANGCLMLSVKEHIDINDDKAEKIIKFEHPVYDVQFRILR